MNSAKASPPLRSFLQRPASDWICFVAAFFHVVWARIQVATVHTKRLARSWGHAQTETLQHRLPPDQNEHVAQVSWAVQAVSRHSPVALVCLPQAMAAQRMLARRSIASTLYLGVRKPEDGEFTAHAWLRAGHRFVTGGRGHLTNATVGCFARLPRN